MGRITYLLCVSSLGKECGFILTFVCTCTSCNELTFRFGRRSWFYWAFLLSWKSSLISSTIFRSLTVLLLNQIMCNILSTENPPLRHHLAENVQIRMHVLGACMGVIESERYRLCIHLDKSKGNKILTQTDIYLFFHETSWMNTFISSTHRNSFGKVLAIRLLKNHVSSSDVQNSYVFPDGS